MKLSLSLQEGSKLITAISYLTMVRATLSVPATKKTAIPIYEPELPLKAGVLSLHEGLTMPGCIRDAAPDAWGRRVIINKKLGCKGARTDTGELDELTYLLESGSDRIGALDFQRSPTEYIPRSVSNVSMEELIESVERVEKGVPLTPELDLALFHGSSIGGARPKALIQDQGKRYVAKFSSSADLYSVVKVEFVAIRLVFNILCGNTDDHARNHAAFWNGGEPTLTPAYDICPQGRTGNEASQAMFISGNNNLSQLKSCLETAHNFLLSEVQTRVIFEKMISTIKRHWDDACEEAKLSEVDKKLLWGRQFLNPFSIE